jgi:hypothetical protein
MCNDIIYVATFDAGWLENMPVLPYLLIGENTRHTISYICKSVWVKVSKLV